MSQPDILDRIDAALTSNMGSQVVVRTRSDVEPVSVGSLVPLRPARTEHRVVGYVVTDAPPRRQVPDVVMAVLTVLGAACLILGCLVQAASCCRGILKPLAYGVAGLVLAKALSVVLMGAVARCVA